MGTRRVAQKEEGHWMQIGLYKERMISGWLYALQDEGKGYAQREVIDYNEVSHLL